MAFLCLHRECYSRLFLLLQSREYRADVEHGPGDVHGIRTVLYLQLQGLLQVFQSCIILLLPTRLGGKRNILFEETSHVIVGQSEKFDPLKVTYGVLGGLRSNQDRFGVLKQILRCLVVELSQILHGLLVEIQGIQGSRRVLQS